MHACGPAQVRQECVLQQRRADAAEAALDTERAAHRADMRSVQRQLVDAQVGEAAWSLPSPLVRAPCSCV